MDREQVLRHPILHRRFGTQWACTIGFGACREGGDDDPRSVVEAIEGGCNVFATAPHYHGGTHERALGEGLRQGLDGGKCTRDSLLVVTKVGMVPELLGDDVAGYGFSERRTHVEETLIGRGLLQWDDLAGSCHTFSPRFIRHSVLCSLERLGLDRVDGVLLDAPEKQLAIATGPRFERRIAAAIEALEELCTEGRVAFFGVATRARLDLERFVELAHDVAGSQHRMRAIEVPLSPLRPAMLGTGEPGNPRQSSMITLAHQMGLYVLATGCLDGGTPRYQFPPDLEDAVGLLPDAAAAIQWVRSAPGVGTALIGMRDPRHVRANLATARLPLLDERVFSTISGGPDATH